MECTYRPRLGQVVLVEGAVTDPGQAPISAIVAGIRGADLVLELTCSSPVPVEGTRVVTSHFAPEALYRMTATVEAEEPGFIRLVDCDHLETVNRRRWPRRTVALSVTLICDDEVVHAGIRGETIDIGIGGALVRAHGSLPPVSDPLVAINLNASETMLITSRVVGSDAGPGYVDYRLAFCDLDAIETGMLADLVRTAPQPVGAAC